MLERDSYQIIIERGHTEVCDKIIDFIKPRIKGKFIDVGSNAGWLISEVPNGVGVDASLPLIRIAKGKNLNVLLAYGESLPIKTGTFDTCVLSTILQQVEKPELILAECLRVSRRIIGTTPFPGKSIWGIVGGNQFVKSIIDPNHLSKRYGALIQDIPGVDFVYYFEIMK